MGSYDKAIVSGFICRLCSKMNKVVIHLYGREGIQKNLAQKINTYLPINVTINDPLPKTVCSICIEKLEVQHRLVLMSKQYEKIHEFRKSIINHVRSKNQECIHS